MGAPELFILGGPNGAGKSTVAQALLPRTVEIHQFVNADFIAEGLSPFAPETTALQAGRLMLERIRALLQCGESFGFETTLAGRTHLQTICNARAAGYIVNLIYIWLRNRGLALSRIADRVRKGGHDVPPETVRRRYNRGLVNFFQLYRPLANTWTLCDNSRRELVVVAQGTSSAQTKVFDAQRLSRIEQSAQNAKRILERRMDGPPARPDPRRPGAGDPRGD